MAYNVLKGSVQFINSDSGSIESMVDDHSDQTIGGIKTFSSAITASGGISSTTYSATSVNSTSGSFAELTISSSTTHTPLLILDKAEASSSFVEFRKEGVKYAEISTNEYETLYIKTDATAYPIFFRQAGKTPLKFQSSMATFQSYPVHVSQSLHVTGSSFINNLSASNEISASAFFGSGQGLTNIPASGLNLGNGVENSGGNLAAKISGSSGLSLTSDGLSASPNNAISIVGGLASADEFLVADNNLSNALRKATITNLQTYMQDNLNFGGAAGSQHQIQFRDGAGSFAASSDLTFNDSTDILNVTGKITASVHVSSSQIYAGELYGNGTGVTQVQKIGFTSPYTASFNVSEQSHIVAVNTSGSSHITASLKAANIYESGAMLVFKDVAGSASANHIVIEPSGSETIDGSNTGIKIQSNYGAVTIASDGNNQFFILGVN